MHYFSYSGCLSVHLAPICIWSMPTVSLQLLFTFIYVHFSQSKGKAQHRLEEENMNVKPQKLAGVLKPICNQTILKMTISNCHDLWSLAIKVLWGTFMCWIWNLLICIVNVFQEVHRQTGNFSYCYETNILYKTSVSETKVFSKRSSDLYFYIAP